MPSFETLILVILVVLVMLRNGGDCITKEVLVLEKREARGVARV
jgi:hypothetical protein